MDQILFSIVAAAALVGASGVGVVAFQVADGGFPQDAGANEAALRGGIAGDPADHHHDDPDGPDHEHHTAHTHTQSGMVRPSFAPAEGSVPTAQEAEDLEQVSRLRIIGDAGFTPSNGVRAGSGTIDDPFVITGYYVTGDLYLQDTDACVVIKENWIGGQLSLNWNAQCVHVHHNHIRDLRVNENIERTGYATGGLLELNEIDIVGQLRHYDGEFRDNVVGPGDARSLFDQVKETAPYLFGKDPRVANVDGFNQGLIHHNTFHGSVDLDFHGHHHGTGFFAPHSHYHGDNESRLMAHDHSKRWTSVAFTDNKVIDHDGYGLRYEDRSHSADDRTANSESLEDLERDHQHWERIEIQRNVIDGAGIWIDVFMADDENHVGESHGWLDIVGNQVTVVERKAEGPAGVPLFGPHHRVFSAIQVHASKEARINITDNRLVFEPRAGSDTGVLGPGGPVSATVDPPEPAAIDLNGVRNATIAIEGNMAQGFHYGVKAHEFDEQTRWWVADSEFGDAHYAIYYDESVKNPPEER